MLRKLELIQALRDLGLQAGDLVHVHSALRKLGPVEGGADGVIDALLEVVGPAGTLTLPTHTWSVVSPAQPVFHQTLTPSNVGALTNVFRLRPGVVRSLHPTHSVAALGPRAAAFVEGHERCAAPCAPESPYGKLRDWGGKILILGETLACCTFFHGCELWAGLPRAISEFPSTFYCITAEGQVIPVSTYGHVVNTWDQYPRLEPGLLAAGAMRVSAAPGDAPLRLLDAHPTAEWVIARLRQDPSIILPDTPQ
jgi:aminoglycoside 3-N-acetyltransferase